MTWAIVGMLVGVFIALELAWWPANMGIAQLTFGRLRPLHTNAVIFAFCGNICFTGIYYSMQRLLKTRMWNDTLSRLHFWGWQLIIVSAALTLPFGLTQTHEYAELIWPIDWAITLVWVIFAVNFFGTIAIRKVDHLYVAIWFYMSFVITIAVLHIVNNIQIPATLTRSYPVFGGLTDALVQWWYGHNAVAFFLTTPFLGLMYYFLPRAAERPIYSYRLSIIHFWSLVFLYIWAGPHHLLYSAVPEWAQTLGMVFSIMLLAPSWGGMINGLLTLRGAWDRVRTDPILKFMVVAISFYGMATFEGPLLSIRAVNGLGHFTNWIIGHVHSGALGWNGMLSFAILYWLFPRLFGRPLLKPEWVTTHFWIATTGHRALHRVDVGRRADRGPLLAGDRSCERPVALPGLGLRRGEARAVLLDAAGRRHAVPRRCHPDGHQLHHLGPRRARRHTRDRRCSAGSRLTPERTMANGQQDGFHRRVIEARGGTMAILTAIAISIGGLVEIVPMFSAKLGPEHLAGVTPLSPLEAAGRDIYIREGCVTCHSQMIRPTRAEMLRYGEWTRAGEYEYDHPFLLGSRRIGPDLQRVGGKYPDAWHYQHMKDPRSTSPGSIMPNYPWLYGARVDPLEVAATVRTLRKVGVPYTTMRPSRRSRNRCSTEGSAIVASLRTGGFTAEPDEEIVALIAYLQRLGKDGTAAIDGRAPTKAPAP